MRLLVALAEADGGLVTTPALMDRLWAGVVVTPNSLYEAVAQLRRALGRGADGSAPIASVPRKGYRLCWPVQRPDVPSLGPRSVAVLPFRARRLPADLDFLPDSLTDAVIGELSRQSELVVLARGTMLAFSGRAVAPPAVGRQLGARFIVDGLLEAEGEVLRVSLQVIDGRLGTQTAADTLQLPLRSWPAMARGVAGRLARALTFEVLGAAARGPGPAGADDDAVAAHTLATRAWVELFARPESATTNERARQWATQAQALDGSLPLAAICLATCDWRAAQFGWGVAPRAEQLARALTQASLAVERAPGEPDAHYVLALVAYSKGETARAEASLRHCLALSPSFAPACGLLALVRTRRGFPQEAAGWCDKAFALSPREPLRAVWHLAKAWAALALDDPAAALEESQRGMAVNPGFATCYLTGAAAAQQLGMHRLAAIWVEQLQRHTVFNSLQAVQAQLPLATEPAHRQQMAQVIGWLRQAGLPAA